MKLKIESGVDRGSSLVDVDWRLSNTGTFVVLMRPYFLVCTVTESLDRCEDDFTALPNSNVALVIEITCKLHIAQGYLRKSLSAALYCPFPTAVLRLVKWLCARMVVRMPTNGIAANDNL